MPASEHFSSGELACKCHCGLSNSTPELLALLECFRTAVSRFRGQDTPVIINRASSCAAHNASVGGVPGSWHVKGMAADVSVADMTAAEMEYLATTSCWFRVGGIGRSDSPAYIHLDVRPITAGIRSKWCYGLDSDGNSRSVNYYPAVTDRDKKENGLMA